MTAPSGRPHCLADHWPAGMAVLMLNRAAARAAEFGAGTAAVDNCPSLPAAAGPREADRRRAPVPALAADTADCKAAPVGPLDRKVRVVWPAEAPRLAHRALAGTVACRRARRRAERPRPVGASSGDIAAACSGARHRYTARAAAASRAARIARAAPARG